MTGFRHRHLGLTIACNQPLPSLARAAEDGAADIVVEVVEDGRSLHADLPWTEVQDGTPVWRADTAEGSFLRVLYSGADGSTAEFVVDGGGSHVWASTSPGVLWEEAAELLLGPVFSCVLSHRGLTCLHAAVVENGGRVVALVGAKGSGKSTTALALVRAGASLVSDDVAVLGELGERPAVAVGAPRLRVRREVAEALGVPYDELSPMWVHEDARPAKRYAEVQVASSSGEGLVALDALYFLGAREGDTVGARPLTAVEVLPRLMAFRHLGDYVARDGHARDFTVLAGVAERVPSFELLRPEGLDAIDQVVAAVLGDVRAHA